MNNALKVLVIAEQEVTRRGLEAMLDMVPEVDAWTSAERVDRTAQELAADHVVIVAPAPTSAGDAYGAVDLLDGIGTIVLIPSNDKGMVSDPGT